MDQDVSDGQPVDKDKENTNPVLRDRELLGLTIASELSVEFGNLTSGALIFQPPESITQSKSVSRNPMSKGL